MAEVYKAISICLCYVWMYVDFWTVPVGVISTVIIQWVFLVNLSRSICCILFTFYRVTVIYWIRWFILFNLQVRTFIHFAVDKQKNKTITKTSLFKYIENFTSKNWKNSDEKLWYFSYFCSKQRVWYSLEPPRRGGSNEYPNLCF